MTTITRTQRAKIVNNLSPRYDRDTVRVDVSGDVTAKKCDGDNNRYLVGHAYELLRQIELEAEEAENDEYWALHTSQRT